jgi:hypothetical protein
MFKTVNTIKKKSNPPLTLQYCHRKLGRYKIMMHVKYLQKR